ncbi:SGNH/GDSL hydrolase family protein [Janibacter sp. Soil728]|uniref:SGNH/GDSL hydrolase family protein n=1 Tax=Janibacter sp. Soil728 TaxID=1736393 RepID=UPI0012E83396|nr:SGNH/GDSL hydrolase family protein [Janibacter sp. Soil728]
MTGLVVVLVNVALVVGLVVWLQGRPDLSAVSESSSTTEAPTSSSSSSSSPTFAEPATVLKEDEHPFVVVLGGDEGTGETGWVQRMATIALERPRTVSYSALEPSDPTKYADPTRSGTGKRLWLRNGSVAGSSISYAANRLRFLVARNADVVVISFQPTTTKGLDRDLNDLLKKVRRQAHEATVAIVLQPVAADGSGRTVRARQEAWAERNRVPTIDVNKAFVKAEGVQLRSEWADSHLTEQGADLWARTVLDRLIGRGRKASSSTTAAETPTVVPPTEAIPEPTTTEVPIPETTTQAPAPTQTAPTDVPPTFVPPSTIAPEPPPAEPTSTTELPPVDPTTTSDPTSSEDLTPGASTMGESAASGSGG